MSRPVLRTRKEIILPAKAGSIVVSFRARKRKGAVKNTRKVSVPRGAEQVAVRIRKTRIPSTVKKMVPIKRKAIKQVPIAKSKAVKKISPVAKKITRPTAKSKTVQTDKWKWNTPEAPIVKKYGWTKPRFFDPLPKKVLHALYACTDKNHSILKGIYYDQRNGNIVASNAHILVCLPAEVKTERIVDKTGQMCTKKYPNYIAIIPRPLDSRIRAQYYISTWEDEIKKALENAEKGQKVLMEYNNTKTKILLDAEYLMNIIKFFHSINVHDFDVESTDNNRSVVLRSIEHSMCLGLIMPFVPLSEPSRDEFFITPLN